MTNPKHDALRHASADQLRADAAFIRNAQTVLGNVDATFERLASLAEAVATMQENSERGAEILGFRIPEWDYGPTCDVSWEGANGSGTTLPAALAAMLDAEGV